MHTPVRAFRIANEKLNTHAHTHAHVFPVDVPHARSILRGYILCSLHAETHVRGFRLARRVRRCDPMMRAKRINLREITEITLMLNGRDRPTGSRSQRKFNFRACRAQWRWHAVRPGEGRSGCRVRTSNGPNPSQLYNQTGNSTTAAGCSSIPRPP